MKHFNKLVQHYNCSCLCSRDDARKYAAQAIKYRARKIYASIFWRRRIIAVIGGVYTFAMLASFANNMPLVAIVCGGGAACSIPLYFRRT